MLLGFSVGSREQKVTHGKLVIKRENTNDRETEHLMVVIRINSRITERGNVEISLSKAEVHIHPIRVYQYNYTTNLTYLLPLLLLIFSFLVIQV